MGELRDAKAREDWLRDLLLDLIQFHIWSDATANEVEEVIDDLNESDAFDSHVAALVQLPKGINVREAQQAVDAAFTRTPPAALQAAVEAERVRYEVIPELPRLTDGIMHAALAAHYGADKARRFGIDGIDLTANDVNHTFAQAFRRMWIGIRKHLAQVDSEKVNRKETRCG